MCSLLCLKRELKANSPAGNLRRTKDSLHVRSAIRLLRKIRFQFDMRIAFLSKMRGNYLFTHEWMQKWRSKWLGQVVLCYLHNSFCRLTRVFTFKFAGSKYSVVQAPGELNVYWERLLFLRMNWGFAWGKLLVAGVILVTGIKSTREQNQKCWNDTGTISSEVWEIYEN